MGGGVYFPGLGRTKISHSVFQVFLGFNHVSYFDIAITFMCARTYLHTCMLDTFCKLLGDVGCDVETIESMGLGRSYLQFAH